jgi:anti-sigma-K factor RskA
MMNHEEWIEQAEIYALGALDEEERTDFEAHLAAGCRECEQRLRDTQETLTLLPRSLEPVSPRPEVKARLLRQIAAESPPPPLELPRRTRGWWGLGVRALIAAGLLLVLSIDVYRTRQALHHANGVVSTLRAELVQRDSALQALHADLDNTRQALQQAEDRVASLQIELARREELMQAERLELQRAEAAVAELQTELAERDESLRLLAAPQVRLVRLAGLAPSPGATAQLLWNPTARTGLLLTSGLPVIPGDKIYELWAIAGNEPVPAGLFTVDEAGHALLRLPPLPATRRFTRFAVTLEPAGGVPKPSGPMLLLGNV